MKVKEHTRIQPGCASNNALLFHSFVRSKFHYPIITNYTPKKLSGLTGVSENSVRKYVGWLKTNGYCIETKDGLFFKRVIPQKLVNKKLVKDKSKIFIEVRPWTSWVAFKRRVYVALIDRHQKQQRWCGRIKKHYEHRNLKVKVDIKKLRKFKKYFNVGDSYDTKSHTSVRGLAKFFGFSKSKMDKILIDLEKNFYIKRIQLIYALNVPKKMQPYLSGYTYVFQGRVCHHQGTHIRVLLS